MLGEKLPRMSLEAVLWFMSALGCHDSQQQKVGSERTTRVRCDRLTRWTNGVCFSISGSKVERVYKSGCCIVQYVYKWVAGQ